MSDGQMMNLDESLKHQIKAENKRLKADIQLWENFYQFHSEAIIITDKELTILSLNTKANKLYKQLGIVDRPRNLKDFFVDISNELVKFQVKKLKQHGYSFDKWTTFLPGSHPLEIEIFAAADREEESGNPERFIYMLMVNDNHLLPVTIGNQNLYADLINGLSHNIVIHNGKGIIIDTNEAFANLLDKERYELIGNSFLRLMKEESAQSFLVNLGNLKTSKECKGFIYMEMEGVLTRYEYMTSYNLHSGLYYTVFTESRKPTIMHSVIHLIEEISTQVDGAILIVQNDGQIIRVNEQASMLFGYPRSALMNLHIRDLFLQAGELDDMLQKSAVNWSVETYCRWPNGKVKLIEITNKPIKDSDYSLLLCKMPHGIYPSEEEGFLFHQKFRRIFDGTFDGILIWREDGRIIDVNAPASEIIGLPSEGIIGQTFQDIFDLDSNQRKHLQRHLSLMARNTQHNFVCELTCKDGQTKQLDFLSRPDIMKGMHLTVFRDITDKLKMEEQLKKSDTLNVVGELAAGIAHEIRNPMTALKGFIQLLEGSLKGDYASYFQVITSELQRIETIITDFLILAKPQAVSYQIKQVNTVLSETLELLSAQAAMLNIQFQTHYGELPLVHCEANQLKQVFINLIKNAIEAMPDGGTIDVSTEPFFDNHILISIQDRGIGIPKSVLKKLGEPFYTTKEKGTGLGLMVTYKIIEEHEGWIEVASKEGEGTLFQIYLPIFHE